MSIYIEGDNVYIFGPLQIEGDEDNFVSLLELLDSDDTGAIINIHIESGGGDLEFTYPLISAIEHAKPYVIGTTSSYAGSCAALILCACHEQVVEDGAIIMFHSTLSPAAANPLEVNKNYFAVAIECMKLWHNKILCGILTKKELHALYTAKKEFFMSGKEFNKRLDKRDSNYEKTR